MKEHIPAGNRELQSRVEAPLHGNPEQKCSGFLELKGAAGSDRV